MTNGDYLQQTYREMAAELPPRRRTEKFILGQISFYESGAEFYTGHDQTPLAEWSRGMAAEWRAKLKAIEAQGAGND